MDRIKERKYIGPYDFGTLLEHARIKRDYQAISDEELGERNLIDVDTDLLQCKIANIIPGSDKKAVEAEMHRIIGAIRDHYFSLLGTN